MFFGIDLRGCREYYPRWIGYPADPTHLVPNFSAGEPSMRKWMWAISALGLLLISFVSSQPRAMAEEKETVEEQLLLRVLRDDLDYLDDDRSVRARITDLKNTDPNVRAMTAFLLAYVGRKAKSAVPALTAALKDKNADVRALAAYG